MGLMQNYFFFLLANGCLPSINNSITKLNLKMKWFLIFLSILVFSFSSIARTGTIVGTITNSLGQKTELATIYLREANKTILSNREGRYEINNIPVRGSFRVLADLFIFPGLQNFRYGNRQDIFLKNSINRVSQVGGFKISGILVNIFQLG